MQSLTCPAFERWRTQRKNVFIPKEPCITKPETIKFKRLRNVTTVNVAICRLTRSPALTYSFNANLWRRRKELLTKAIRWVLFKYSVRGDGREREGIKSIWCHVLIDAPAQQECVRACATSNEYKLSCMACYSIQRERELVRTSLAKRGNAWRVWVGGNLKLANISWFFISFPPLFDLHAI